MTPEFQAFMEENFSLDNYAGAADLDLKAWHDLFWQRFIIRMFLPIDIEEVKKLLNNPIEVLNYSLLKNEYPVSVIKDWGLYDYFMSKKNIESMEEEFKPLQEIWDAELTRLKFSRSYLKFGKKSLSEDQMAQLGNKFTIEALKTKAFTEVEESKRHLMQSRHKPSKERDLKVDLDYPDDILKKGFDEWLISARTQTNISRGDRHVKRAFNNSDIERWVQRQTLPYIDIRIASKLLECKLNDDEIGYYLFRELPIGVNSRDKLRAVKKRAEQMSDLSVLASLGACTIPTGDEQNVPIR